MKDLIFRFASMFLLSAVALTGCQSRGTEFLGNWVNTQNPKDTFQVMRNGDEYIIVGQDQKTRVGAIYKDGALEIKGALLSANLTYVKQTDTILAQVFSVRSSTGERSDRAGTNPGPASFLSPRVRLLSTRKSQTVLG